MKKLLIILAIGLVIYGFTRKPEPRIGQVYQRTIETSYGYGNHIDTILIINIDEINVTFTRLDKYDEWLCPISSIKQYGRLIK